MAPNGSPRQPSKDGWEIRSIAIQRPLIGTDAWMVTVRVRTPQGKKRSFRAHGTSYLDACYNLQMRGCPQEVRDMLTWQDAE